MCQFYARINEGFITTDVTYLKIVKLHYEVCKLLSYIQNKTPFIAQIRKNKARIIRVQRMLHFVPHEGDIDIDRA